MDAKAPLNKAQIAALRQLAEPDVTGRSALYFNRSELNSLGAPFMQLVELKLADRAVVSGGWSKFTITKQGKEKFTEVQRG